jgi:DNA-binding response OmpR family regulator
VESPEVLVVDDEPAIRRALERALRLEGFTVRTASGGKAALEAVANDAPDVIVLDIAMPDLDGVAVTNRLRADGIDVPICVVSARDEVDDRVAGLQAGADDYVVKPFALPELVARLHALLRRRPEPPSLPVLFADLHVDPARRQVRRGTRTIELTRREFDLLETFIRHPGLVLTRSQLLTTVWGYDFEVDSNVVDVFVGYLRRKLEAGGEPRLLHTVRGVGFVLRRGSE